MTTKEVAQICGVTEKTVRENAKTFGKVFENGKPTEWTEEELKRLQLVLMANAQNNNANTSEVVKETSKTVFQLGTLANVALTSGNIEAISDIDGFKYSKEDICNMCNVSAITFDRFLALSPVTKRDFISTGSSHKKLYNENVLKQFQLWLMKNQVNQGTQVSIVKSTVESTFEVGLVAKACLDSPEAWEQFKRLGDSLVEQKLQAKQLEEQNQLLLEQKEAAEKETARIYQCNRNFHNSLYTASDIAKKLGITPNMVGRIANENGLKQDPIYGKLGKIQLNNGKWVNQFYYNEDALTVIESVIG